MVDRPCIPYYITDVVEYSTACYVVGYRYTSVLFTSTWYHASIFTQ